MFLLMSLNNATKITPTVIPATARTQGSRKKGMVQSVLECGESSLDLNGDREYCVLVVLDVILSDRCQSTLQYESWVRA